MKPERRLLPGSKSYAQRAIVCAALADGVSTLHGVTLCEDVSFLLQAVQDLGAKAVWKRDVLEIRGEKLRPFNPLFVGESGLAARLLAPVCALFDAPMTVQGYGSLRRRPMGPIVTALRALGAQASGDFIPLQIQGPLRGGRVEVDASGSSQFLSGLLLALPRAASPSQLIVHDLVSAPYIGMTLDTAAAFGVRIKRHDDTFFIERQSYLPCDYTVEADWSAAAFLLVAGAVHGAVSLTGLNPDSLQGDRVIVEALRAAGADVSITAQAIRVSPAPLRPFEFDCTHCPDLIPPLVALAAFCPGCSTFNGASRLRYKESNRGTALVEVFGQLGIRIEIEGDVLRVHGGPITDRARVKSHNDHRIAMAAAVAGIRAHVHVERQEVVAKSFPQFFEVLDQLWP